MDDKRSSKEGWEGYSPYRKQARIQGGWVYVLGLKKGRKTKSEKKNINERENETEKEILRENVDIE